MSKVFMTKSAGDAEWGFDLDTAAAAVKGSDNSSSVIKVSKVNEDSPAYGKLSVGDRLVDIAGNSTSELSLADAWDLIKKCSNALFLTIEKNGSEPPATSEPPSTAAAPAKTTTIREMATALERAARSPKPAAVEPAKELMQQPWKTAPEQTKKEPLQYTKVSLANQTPQPFRPSEMGGQNQYFAAPEQQYIPDAPPLTEELIKQNRKKSNVEPIFKSQESDKEKLPSEYEQRIPEKLLKSMTRPGMKPFTYTPRGVDLQEVMEKARNRRRAHRRAQPPQPEEWQVEHGITETSPYSPSSMSVQQMSASFSGQPYSPPVSQSRSFHRLQGWVEENELTYQGGAGQPTETFVRSPVAMAIEESNTASNPSNRTIPSNAFRILQQSCGSVDLSHNPQAMAIERERYERERATQELYRRVPARDREREPEAHKYQGADIPSKSFRLLQEYTTTGGGGGDRTTAPGGSATYISMQPEQVQYDHRQQASVPSRSFRLLQQLSGEDTALQTSTASRMRGIEKSSVYTTDF